ncbi:MAG: signal peptidase I [Candidatus Paceibacterota bacterium]
MKRRVFISIAAIIALLSLIIFAKGIVCKENPSAHNGQAVRSDCFSSKEMTVRGNSMSPFFDSGDVVNAMFGYYDCNPVQRNDVVLFRYSGNENLLIKFVKGVPGDRWWLEKTDEGRNIIVNGSPVLNSEGKPYLIAESSVGILEIYIKDYPVIPEETYLLLGDGLNGSLDSTHFGLVGKKDILAKVF